jgi:hypothetical protein
MCAGDDRKPPMIQSVTDETLARPARLKGCIEAHAKRHGNVP